MKIKRINKYKMIRKYTYFSYLLVFMFFACKKEEKIPHIAIKKTFESTITKQDSSLSVKKEIKRNNWENVIIHKGFKDSLKIHFSNLKTEDRFVFELPAGNINKTSSSIKIYNSEDELIYKKEFLTREIINGYAIDDRFYTDEEVEAYILEEAESILSYENFINLELDIEKGSILDQGRESFENYSVFMECKSEKRPLFVIGLAEEDISYIGFSSRRNSVFDVIYCC